MELNDYFNIVFFLISASVGIIFRILQMRIVAKKNAENLHKIFMFFSIFICIFSGFLLAVYWNDLLLSDNSLFKITTLFIGILVGITLLVLTSKYLSFKNIFKTSELDPIVNYFTSNADKDEIKLFGGDLNFFGNYPDDMDKGSQYIHLKTSKFKRVLILCESPSQQMQKCRYGKILVEIAGVELRFYEPQSADLKVRGRISQVGGVNKLLMYKKVRSKTYKAIETDTADPDGALYTNIWELVWAMALKPTDSELQEYRSIYTNSR